MPRDGRAYCGQTHASRRVKPTTPTKVSEGVAEMQNFVAPMTHKNVCIFVT
jgi:hypothetical protein